VEDSPAQTVCMHEGSSGLIGSALPSMAGSGMSRVPIAGRRRGTKSSDPPLTPPPGVVTKLREPDTRRLADEEREYRQQVINQESSDRRFCHVCENGAIQLLTMADSQSYPRHRSIAMSRKLTHTPKEPLVSRHQSDAFPRTSNSQPLLSDCLNFTGTAIKRSPSGSGVPISRSPPPSPLVSFSLCGGSPKGTPKVSPRPSIEALTHTSKGSPVTFSLSLEMRIRAAARWLDVRQAAGMKETSVIFDPMVFSRERIAVELYKGVAPSTAQFLVKGLSAEPDGSTSFQCWVRWIAAAPAATLGAIEEGLRLRSEGPAKLTEVAEVYAKVVAHNNPLGIMGLLMGQTPGVSDRATAATQALAVLPLVQHEAQPDPLRVLRRSNSMAPFVKKRNQMSRESSGLSASRVSRSGLMETECSRGSLR